MPIGETLVSAREAAGLSIQDVADRTRIRRTVVEQIERGDFGMCGGDVYARGHLRNIAAVVGLDPVPLLAEYDREHRPHAPSATQVFESETGARPERRGPNWTAAMAAALVVVAAIGLFQVVRGGSEPSTTADDLLSSAPSGSSSSSPTASSPAAAPSSSAVAVLPSSAGVTVQLTVAKGKSWVSATAATDFQGLLDAGESKVFTDPRQVKLVIGNAGAVRLVVNGRDIGAPGGSGQVVRLTFGPGDPTAAG